MTRGLKLPYERFDDAEKYSKREYDESPDDPETREIPDEVERVAEKTADELERQVEVERAAERAAQELDEAESRHREVEEAAERAAKELDELENDLDEVRDELHDEYVNDMNRHLEGVSSKDSEAEEGGEDRSSSEMTENTESYEDAGTGMVYAMETRSEAESHSEVESEVEDEPTEQEEATETVDEVDESPDEKFRNKINRQESPENEHEEYKSSESVEDVEKQRIQRTETNESSGNIEPEVVDGETRQQHKPEIEHEVPSESAAKGGTESVDELAQVDVESEPEESHEIVEPSDVSEVHDETEVDELEHQTEPDVESQNETETQEVSDDVRSDVESSERVIEESEVDEISEAEDFPEELEDFVRRVQDILDEMDADDGYDYVQDLLTGEMQRIPKILSEYEFEEQKRRRKLRNLFSELSEEECERFKEIVREREESEDKGFAEQVERLWTRVVEKGQQKQNAMIENPEDYLPWEITTWNRFQSALNHHNELRFRETFDKQCEMIQDYFDGKSRRKSKFLKELESFELRRSFEDIVGTTPEISIESMQDVESIRVRNKRKPLSVKEQDICRKYFEVCNNWSLTEKQLSFLHGISASKVHRWRNRIEPPPIAKLRQCEEMRILKKWATLKQFKSEPKFVDQSYALEQSQDSKQTSQWTTTESMDLIDLHKDAFFYFTSKNDLAQFLLNIKQKQGWNGSAGLHSTLQYLNKLLLQTFPQNRSKTYISVRYSRIKGEYLRFLLNLSTWSTSDLERNISKISGTAGTESGSIPNPKFPQGTELEIVLARIVSIVISDSHLRSNGSIIYHEPDIRRIRIVEKYLQAFGNIKLSPIFDKKTNHYVTNLPSVIGKVMLQLGLIPGNKTLQNPGLFPSILNFSREALCAIMEELIPQDGTVKPNRIDWSHSHTLFPGFKDTTYKVKPIISQEEVDLVIKHGVPYKHYKRLSKGKLDRLTKDKNQDTSRIATKLMNLIFKNPNNFVEYEVRIASILGVKIEKTPQSIFYHKRTGAVTVSWGARTVGKIEALRLAMIAPPNDIRKRQVMRKSILDNPAIVEKIVSENRDRGMEVKRWWNKDELDGGPDVI